MKIILTIQLSVVLLLTTSYLAVALPAEAEKVVVTMYGYDEKKTHQKGDNIYYKLNDKKDIIKDSEKANYLVEIIKSKKSVPIVLGINEGVGFIRIANQFFNIKLLNVGANRKRRVCIIPIEEKGEWFAERGAPPSRHVEVSSDFYVFLKNEFAR